MEKEPISQIPTRAELVPKRIQSEKGTYSFLGEHEEDSKVIQMINTVLEYVDLHRLIEKKPTEGDCATVAGAAVKALDDYFERHGYAFGIAVTEVHGGIIPLYKTIGYGHHIINVAIGVDECVAFDLTAKYTLPEQQSDLLVVSAKNERELLQALSALTGSSWELR
jgi:uncharacterized alkaline shock family protein YloU